TSVVLEARTRGRNAVSLPSTTPPAHRTASRNGRVVRPRGSGSFGNARRVRARDASVPVRLVHLEQVRRVCGGGENAGQNPQLPRVISSMLLPSGSRK